MPCCVHMKGYHVYHTVWMVLVGEELVGGREPTNVLDIMLKNIQVKIFFNLQQMKII